MTETDVFNTLKGRTYNPEWRAYVWRNSAGQKHRDGGPAVEHDGGVKAWYQNDLLHRTDGPAIEYSDGLGEWWIDGRYLTEE